jgi:hypothetical protein
MPPMSRPAGRRVWGIVVIAVVLGSTGAASAQTMSRSRVMPTMVADEPSHASVSLELGPGGIVSRYNLNAGPSQLLLFTGFRASYDFTNSWAGSLVVHQWWLPANHATMLGVGLRFAPIETSFGRWWLNANAGAVTTRYAYAFGFDAGGGFEWDLPVMPGMSIGPYARYGSVVNPDRAYKDDGRAWTVGAAFTYHFGRGAAVGGPGGAVHRRSGGGSYKISIPDSDGDGVGDDQDVCRTVKQGKHPDPYKAGCPENDEDGDDIPDIDDACPATAPGGTPDPKRPGCPLRDSDGDGISDSDDACPTRSGVTNEDPARNGCPAGKRRSTVGEPEADGPRPEDSPGPKAVKKRKMK